jgi:hypothetical protein
MWLMNTGNVRESCRQAGISWQAVYKLRRADTSGGRKFAEEWADCEAMSGELLEQEARRRGVEGVLEPVISGGRVAMTKEVTTNPDGSETTIERPLLIRRYSDRLLELLMRGWNGKRYGDKLALSDADGKNLPAGSLAIVHLKTELVTALNRAEQHRERLAQEARAKADSGDAGPDANDA